MEVVERSTRVPFPADLLYAWHARPGAVERLTPPWERVDVLERVGGLDNEQAGMPVRVRPFAHWVHTHCFTPDRDSNSILTDRVEFTLRGGALGAWTGRALVRRRIERLLAYRHALLATDLSRHARFAERGPLRIAVTGASGLVGRSLAAFLSTGGHTVLRVVRRMAGPGEIAWEPGVRIDAAALEGTDAVVHLAGENVAAGRWTPARRRRIRDSRVSATAHLAESIAGLHRPPAVLVSAAAIGIYGERGDEVLDDTSPVGAPGRFLGDLCREWEAAAEPARQAGIRVALPRFGAVLSPAGGALGKMLPVFHAGLGGPLGGGRQWMSWLSVEDAIGAVHHAVFTASLQGTFNAVAPAPVTNAEFTRTLGAVLGRPAVFPVPAAALRLALGPMAEETILASARVVPSRLLASGYAFHHPTLESALRFELGR
ncbi:MAG TPA: TIGR01777 family oxidoreductase [Gemmatimonadales bacterium]|nr:TIGR01777 family oxidoreductase [Gemmatimonadales bacterium]